MLCHKLLGHGHQKDCVSLVSHDGRLLRFFYFFLNNSLKKMVIEESCLVLCVLQFMKLILCIIVIV